MKKGKRKNKKYNYMVGLMPNDGESTKDMVRTSKHMSLSEARKKGVKIFDKELPTDPVGSDVFIWKKEKGRYKTHSYYTGEWEEYE